MHKKVAAIVLNWKDVDRTLRCVESLCQASELDSIIIVDNESDGSLQRAFSANPPSNVLVVESEENLGFSAGVNLGIASVGSDTDYLLMINNDAVLLPGSLEVLVRSAVTSKDLGLCAPLITNLDGSVQSRGEKFSQLSGKIRPVRRTEVPDFLTWACVLVPMATIDRVGLLDEGFFMYWEDVDYGLRCKSLGLDLIVVEDAKVYHELSASHGRASSRIDMYSTLGLVVLSKKLGGRAYLGLAWRAVLRLGKRLGRLDFAGLMFVSHGIVLGLRSKEPAYMALRNR